MADGRPQIDPNESKDVKFQRVCAHRVEKALERINMLNTVFDRTRYEYTDDQVETVFDAIAEQVAVARSKAMAATRTKPTFSF